MTRRSTKQCGISLVEVVLTLGISSLLLATIMTGRNSVRSNAQFSDGVERIKEQVLAAKSDANTGKNTYGKGTTSLNRADGLGGLLLGASLRFRTAADTTMQTANIICYTVSSTVLKCGSDLTTQTAIQKTITTPWNIKYTGYTTPTNSALTAGELTLAFGRDDQTGNFMGAWYPGVIASGTKLTAVFNDPAHQGVVVLHFKSQDGRNATITVNTGTGAVTREFL
jgi:hypothetical protein